LGKKEEGKSRPKRKRRLVRTLPFDLRRGCYDEMKLASHGFQEKSWKASERASGLEKKSWLVMNWKRGAKRRLRSTQTCISKSVRRDHGRGGERGRPQEGAQMVTEGGIA